MSVIDPISNTVTDTITVGNGPAAWGDFVAPFPASGGNKADQLRESGVPGKGLEDAKGLQKEFNDNSKAGEKAGKK